MSTEQSVRSAVSEYKRLAGELLSKNNEYASRVAAIDPKSPDANRQLSTIRDERSAFLESSKTELLNVQKMAFDGAKELNDPALNQFVSSELTQAARVFPNVTSVMKNAIAKLEAEIESANKDTTVNDSESDAETRQKYENSEVVSVTSSQQIETNEEPVDFSQDYIDENGRNKPVPPGAIPPIATPARVNWNGIVSDEVNSDLRVKLRVPKNYYTPLLTNSLKELKAIIFPYTPTINIEHKADYASFNALHSNYTQYFYKSSNVTPINVSGKFTVANEYEADIFLATVHLLRALTKMRSGGPTGDFDSGAPPPVCRFDAYGTFMLQNVPVVLTNFKLELPDNVDYYTLGKNTSAGAYNKYEMTAVPVISTISITLNPMYSREEIRRFNVTDWLGEKNVRKAGYL